MARKQFWRFQIVRGGHRKNCHHVKISVASHTCSALLKYAYMRSLQVDLFAYVNTIVCEKTRNVNECVLKVLKVDWLQSFKQFFINVSYHILVNSLTLMALFKTKPPELDWLHIYDMTH